MTAGSRARTNRQVEYLAGFVRFVQARGVPPTVRELGEEMGVTSTNAISSMLSRLQAGGLLERSPTGRGGPLVLTRKAWVALGIEPIRICPHCGGYTGEKRA